MKRTILIPTAPLSINRWKARDARYLTPAAKDFIRTVLYLIDFKDSKKALKDLRESFNPKEHVYKLDIVFSYPESIFYTAKGNISSRAHDLSNIEKTLIDVIFTPKFYGDNVPNQAHNLNIDDKYITELRSCKVAKGDKHLITMKIEIIKRIKNEKNK